MRVRGEKFPHLVLLAGEINAQPPDLGGLGIEVDHKLANLAERWRVFLGAAHDGVTGWMGLPEYWSVVDGSISGHQTKEMSKQTFLVRAGLIVKSFELRLKYRFASPQGNSGIQFRSRVLDPMTFRVGGYQATFRWRGASSISRR
jgi:hypothetical protein